MLSLETVDLVNTRIEQAKGLITMLCEALETGEVSKDKTENPNALRTSLWAASTLLEQAQQAVASDSVYGKSHG